MTCTFSGPEHDRVGATTAFKQWAADGKATLHLATINGDHEPGLFKYTTGLSAMGLSEEAFANPVDGNVRDSSV